MANISAIKLPNGTTYDLKDNGALQLTGGQVTGPVTFGDSIYADDLTAGQLVVEGNASVTNNLQANTINGVAVGNNPKFTDTNTEVSTLTLASGSTAGTTLTYGGKYTLTAGSKTVSFTMPSADDTNTWRTIQVNGTDILGSGTNTGKLNLKAGTNVSISNSSGTVTISSTDTNTHNTAYLYAGASDGNANAATTNGNTHLILVDGGSVTTRRKISGSGATTVTSDASGNIVINSTDTNTHNTYTISTTGSGNAVTAVSLSGTTFTVTKGATYSNNAGTITSVKTTAGTHSTINVTSGAANFNVPTKTSHLTNDSGFITDAGVTGVKGNSESSYRTGQVNLTAANIGAVATSGNETVAGNKTFSGTTTLSVGSVYPASQNTIIVPNAGAIIQSPIPKYLWHDIIAFCKATTPTYYTTTNGSTWTTATLEKRLFAHMNNWGNQQILNSSIQGSRWVWHGGGFAYSSLSWIILGITYNTNIATFDLLLETTADATASSPTWTTLCSVTGAKYNQQPIWIKASGPSSTGDLRLTITRSSGDTTTNVLPLCAIQFLTTRWGDQGKGSEFEYPYNWDGIPNIYPIQNNVSSLGTSSYKWANIYATTFTGNLTGNVTGNVSGTAGGVAWSNVSSKPTATGSSATGITASTTATKTTLGTAFTIPNVTSAGSASTWAFEDVACDDITAWNAGSASSWTFEEKSIPNVTSAGSASTWAFTGVTVANSIAGAVDSNDSTQLNITLGTTTVQSKSGGGNGSAPTLGTAIKVQSKSGGSNGTAPSLSYTAKTASHVKSGGNGSAPTLGTAFTVPNVTANATGAVTITDPKHTHTIS